VEVSSVSIQSSLFSGNTSAAGGGAITLAGRASSPSDVLIKSSSLLGNTAETTGGGINFLPEAGQNLAGSALTLTGSTVSGNVGSNGGGLYATGGGAVTVMGGAFEGNRATTYGGGIGTSGLVALKTDLRVSGTLFRGNSSGATGGAITTNGAGTVSVENVQVIGNLSGRGGGMYLTSTSGITVAKSLFQRNHATGIGGGLVINAAVPLVTGSKFLGNTAAASGGGLAIEGGVAGQVLNTTITGNVAGSTGGGLDNDTGGSVDLTGTKIGGNFAPANSNLFGASTNFTPPVAPALAGTILVTSLVDNGTDSVDEITLREAIALANALPNKDTIAFAATLFAGGQKEIPLSGTDLDITAPLVIKGPGVEFLSVSGNSLSRIFNIDDGNAGVDSPVAISGLTLRKGDTNAVSPSGLGGAILSHESLALKQTVLTGNKGSAGGGVYLYGVKTGQAVKLTVTESIVTGNTADTGQGGGIYAGSAVAGILISTSTISGNAAQDGSGGGLYLKSRDGAKPAVVDACVIIGNSASDGGGGIILASDNKAGSGILTIKNTVVAGNTAALFGGGIYVRNEGVHAVVTKSLVSNNSAAEGGGLAATNGADSLAISGTTILANRATDALKGGGGGLFVNAGPVVSVQSSLFSGNTSASNGGAISVTGELSDPVGLTTKGTSILGNNAAIVGGGISALGRVDLALAKSVVSGNAADGGGGGGIYATGITGVNAAGATVTVKGGSFAGNFTVAYGGGICSVGDGAAEADLSVTGALFLGNVAGNGGGVYTQGQGTVKIVTTRVIGNLATVDGGGGMELKSKTSVSVIGSLFERNHAAGKGGGLLLDVLAGAASLVSGSKLFGNTSTGSGGGIAVIGGEAGAILKSTVTGNVSGISGGGIFSDAQELLDLTGSKVTGNFAPLGPNVLETII
jgi:predicted outer membrane repeat protein